MERGDRMSGQRQDAWTAEEDLVLAEIVLNHIRQGSTQLAAFDEVGQKLSRTSAACGFRWNSTIRKKYEKAIALAKKERKQRYLQHTNDEKKSNVQHNLTLDDVIQFLQMYSTDERSIEQLKAQNKKLQAEMEREKETYERKIAELKKENDMLKQDYKAMFDIIERASKLISVEKNEKK